TARKNAGSPRRNRNLLGCEVFTQAGDERADDLVLKRTTPAVELRDDELVCAGAGDDLLPVDVVRNLDGPDRQRRVGCSLSRAVADLERRQRVEAGLARAPQAAREREEYQAGEKRWQADLDHPGHCFPFSTASGWRSR